MKDHSLQQQCRNFLMVVLSVSLGTAAYAQENTITNANASIGLLSGQKAVTAAKLAAVKQEIQDFTVNIMIPHNKDAAEQKRQLDAVVAAGYDPNSQASVDAYNQKIGTLNAWGDRIDAEKERETPRYVDMKTREADYTQTITDLENRINDIIRRYTPDCANASSSEEAVNCWAIYFDGENKRKSLDNTPVYPGTNFFSNGLSTTDKDAFKIYRNDQLNKINSGINNIVVPKPVAPPPAPKSIMDATGDLLKKMRDFMNNNDTYKKRRVAPAVLAVRG